MPEGTAFEGIDSLRGKRIATTYPFMLERFLREQGISAEIVKLSGAVEIAPRLGRADLICDLVSTGSTLQANHLREALTILESHAVLIRSPVMLAPLKSEWVERLLMRIDGVEQVKESKYIMLHAARFPQSANSCPAANHRRLFRSKARRNGWRFMPSAVRTSFGRRSRA